MKKFETVHLSPHEQTGERTPHVHLLKTFNQKGEVVGFAELVYFGGKIPFYFVRNLGNITLSKHSETKEVGVANELITKINEFLDLKKYNGVLVNTSDVPDLYLHRGWKKSELMPGLTYYGDITQEQLLSMLDRIASSLSRDEG